MSCGTTRPAPRFSDPLHCCRSVLREDPRRARRVEQGAGAFAQRRCQVGVRPLDALPSRPDESPSRRARSDDRGARPMLFAILEGCNLAGPSAPFQLCWGSSRPCRCSPSALRVTTDGPGFARSGWKAPGPPGTRCRAHGGEVQGDWQGVMLEADLRDLGGPDAARATTSPSRARRENLRSAPQARSSGNCPRVPPQQGLEGTVGSWIHVTRAGWLERRTSSRSRRWRARAPPYRTRTPPKRDRPLPASRDPQTPGRGSGSVHPTRPRVPVPPLRRSARVESARRTVLYRSRRPARGTLAPSAPLRVLGRSGD